MASDRISAWRAATGETAWTSEALQNRGLSAPLVAGSAVAFGDAEGTVHFLSRDKGATVLRLQTDGSAITTAPGVRQHGAGSDPPILLRHIPTSAHAFAGGNDDQGNGDRFR